MFYITGDTHGQFDRVERLCSIAMTTIDDVLIILGDAGINYYGGKRDQKKKQMLSALPITVFSLHGNHEKRPSAIETYKIKQWKGGAVYYEEAYPNLLFAIDGEVYDFAGKKCIVIGGAYSVDKFYRLAQGYNWWPDEQPSDEIKRKVEARLESESWHIDVVLTHTTPVKYEPLEVFLSCIDQNKVDKSTENWLGYIEKRLDYSRWYCGHYHTEKTIDKMVFMFESIREFHD